MTFSRERQRPAINRNVLFDALTLPVEREGHQSACRHGLISRLSGSRFQQLRAARAGFPIIEKILIYVYRF
jgi:hypothetical protein